jgi:hypothetical protein
MECASQCSEMDTFIIWYAFQKRVPQPFYSCFFFLTEWIVLIYISCLINIHNTILGAKYIHQKLNSTWEEENCINFLDLTIIKNWDKFEFNQETYYPLPKTISYIANLIILMNIRKEQLDTLHRD